MIPPFLDLQPEALTGELMDMSRKTLAGIEALASVNADEIQVGFSPKTEVWSLDGVTLYRYEPKVNKPHAVPLLISYALVNRPYMVDLEEGRSLVQNLLDRGLDIYLIDWGYPTRADRWRTLDDYVNTYLDGCIEAVCQASGQDSINLLGICQGGALSLCYAALHPERIRNLITMVTPVDFEPVDESGAPCGMLNAWARDMDIDAMVDAMGNIPGDFMNFGFVLMKPFALNIAKYGALLDIVDDEARLANFLRMEKWIFDSPDQAGEAYRQFLKTFYQQNKLIQGEVEIGGRKIDLGNIKMPVLNIFAEKDHLVPPASSKALGDHVGSDDYSVLSFPTGHIGMYVSGKVQAGLPPAIADWLIER